MSGISSFSGLQLSLRALLAEQRALDTTAQNIANAGTVGYTRQEAVLTAARPVQIDAGVTSTGQGAMLGQGVDVLELRRVRDVFSDLQYRAQGMTYGQQDTYASALDAAQDLLDEPSDTGLSALLGKFWTSWQSLATNPESAAAKTAVVATATNVAAQLGSLDAGLAQLQSAAATQSAQLLAANGPVGKTATELGTLDRSITEAIAAGLAPNDLLDRRDVLLDQLSAYGQVSVTELGGGSISVQFGDAALPLVNAQAVTWPQSLTAAAGGKLGALADLASSTGPIGTQRAALDAVAAALTSSVNAVHPTPFFSGTTAASLAVVATPATVRPGSTAAAGANDVALALANLRAGAADTAYGSAVAAAGSAADEANRRTDTAKALRAAADERRQSTGGVSIDEEMTNLVKFQRGYQAASRALSTMDEMLDVLINRTGRVGL